MGEYIEFRQADQAKVPLHITNVAGEPLPFVNVAYLDANGQTTSQGTMTNQQGVAMVIGPMVRVSHVGYQTTDVEIGANGGAVVMQSTTYEIPMFTVKGKRARDAGFVFGLIILMVSIWYIFSEN